MSIKEGQPTRAIIKDIKPSNLFGAEGDFPVAIVQKCGEPTEAWYPLEANHGFVPGDRITVTPKTRHHKSGGSLTTHRLDPL